jgi:hypothetical protein
VPTATAARLFLAVDGSLHALTGAFAVGASFAVSFVPIEYDLVNGSYALEFYAVDSDGDVSEPSALTVALLDIPAATDAAASAAGTQVLGIAIGVAGGAAVVIAIVVVVVCLRKRSTKEHYDENVGTGSAAASDGYIDKELLKH